MAIALYESFRAVFYTPFYLAHALGAYAAEGVEVALTNSPDLDYRSSHRSGEGADVYWGGPMRLMVGHDRDPASPIVGFCEVVARDPFFLVGRARRKDFRFADLQGLRFASVSEVPTPWMCLQDDLRRAGVDPASLNRTADGTMPGNSAALRDGRLDVVQLFQPFVEQLVSDGAGHIWNAAATRGPCSYTTFYAPRSTLRDRSPLLRFLVRAVQRHLHLTRAQHGDAEMSHAQLRRDVAVCGLIQRGDHAARRAEPALVIRRFQAFLHSACLARRGCAHQWASLAGGGRLACGFGW